MKIFLDDIRNPSDCVAYMYKRIGALNPIYLEKDWFIVRDYSHFCDVIARYSDVITHVSFDHDLADGHYHDSMDQGKEAYEKHLETIREKTGLDCAKYLKELYAREERTLPVMFVHSMNPVGTENIVNLFKK